MTSAAKRLPCAKVIKPGEVEHPGPHIHSNDAKPFHYCDSRLVGFDSASCRRLLVLGAPIAAIYARILLVQFQYPGRLIVS